MYPSDDDDDSGALPASTASASGKKTTECRIERTTVAFLFMSLKIE